MRITAAQLNYQIGDFSGNVAKILTCIEQHAATSDLIVFTELCLSGCYPYDLIERHSFIQAQDNALLTLIEKTKNLDCAIALGLIAKNTGKGKPYHNGMVVIEKGKIVYEHHKQLLPVYNIFDEARNFEPGHELSLFSWRGMSIAFLICEDAWSSFEGFYREDPIQKLIDKKPDLCIVLNASPSNVGKCRQRLEHMKQVVKTLNVPLIYVNQVGGNDDIVYDGQSFVLDNKQNCLGVLPAFEEAAGRIYLTPSKIQCEDAFKQPQSLYLPELLFQQIKLGLKDYLKKCGFDGVVIGISGGIDSAVTVALAVKALGPDKVHGLFMPTRFTSDISMQCVQALCDTFKMECHSYPLEKEYAVALEDFSAVFKQRPNSITDQNIQARIRGRVLMEYSNHTGYLVLSTGNKSEISVGYTTLYGDTTGGFNIIGDVYKTQVYELARYFNTLYPETPIPDEIITRIPTAELAAGQKDTDTLPPYEVLDPILKVYLEGDLLENSDRQACEAMLKTIPEELVLKVHRMVDNAEFKRRQSPPILRVQRRSFGIGRRMPISAKFYVD